MKLGPLKEHFRPLNKTPYMDLDPFRDQFRLFAVDKEKFFVYSAFYDTRKKAGISALFRDVIQVLFQGPKFGIYLFQSCWEI